MTKTMTEAQCAALNAEQRRTDLHPMTCGGINRTDDAHIAAAKMRDDHDYGILIATPTGWQCCACDYTQPYGHAAQWSMTPRTTTERETLIAAGFASLVEVVGVIRRQGGFLRTEDQQALFRAERIIEQAKVTP